MVRPANGRETGHVRSPGVERDYAEVGRSRSGATCWAEAPVAMQGAAGSGTLAVATAAGGRTVTCVPAAGMGS